MFVTLNSFYEYSSHSYFMDPVLGAASAPSLPSIPSPPSYWASISGTSVAGPAMSCHFYSGTNVDYTSVEWLVDGNVVGTSANLTYSSSSSYTLVVHYFDSYSGGEAWETHDVTVYEGAGQCFDE